jgi:peptidylprolyl isomerase
VELAPEFAPNHVARMRALVRAHFFDHQSFYRVIDGFVAQGGNNADKPDPKWRELKAEFDRPVGDDATFTPLGDPDLYAPEVGHVDGFPVGRDPKTGRVWIAHCPGTFAFARDNSENSATTEFYIVIGEAVRRLDRNLTAFGRVISGMDNIQKLNRGDPDVDNGVIKDPKNRDVIIRMRMASDIPAKDRPKFQVMRTDSPAFTAVKDKKRHPAKEFYQRDTPTNLEVCLPLVPVRRAP